MNAPLVPGLISKDPDDLHGDEPVAIIRIAIRRNGAMSVEGAIEHEPAAIAMIDAARDAVRDYHARQRMQRPSGLILPANEVPALS